MPGTNLWLFADFFTQFEMYFVFVFLSCVYVPLSTLVGKCGKYAPTHSSLLAGRSCTILINGFLDSLSSSCRIGLISFGMLPYLDKISLIMGHLIRRVLCCSVFSDCSWIIILIISCKWSSYGTELQTGEGFERSLINLFKSLSIWYCSSILCADKRRGITLLCSSLAITIILAISASDKPPLQTLPRSALPSALGKKILSFLLLKKDMKN